MQYELFKKFAPIIKDLCLEELAGSDSLKERLRINRQGSIEICYVPFEHINLNAKIVIVGITPGRTQMINAVQEARKQLDAGANVESVLAAAKKAAAFSGPMRANLVKLLDKVELNRWLGIQSCDALFGEASGLVQTTSVLRNAVFLDGGNYGGTPNMIRTPLLREYLLSDFGQEAKALPNAVFLPLGNTVAQALKFVADHGLLMRDRILDELPHPSGANVERIAYFLGQKSRADLSKKTSAAKLDAAREKLLHKVKALSQAT